MRRVIYYKTLNGESPIDNFLKSLSPKQFEKVVWVLATIRDMPFISNQYFKKLRDTDGIWEVGIDAGNDTFRLLPSKERKNIKNEDEMDDLDRTIADWKQQNPELANEFDEGYENFKIGVLFKSSREQAGMTQEEVARKLGTKKSAISRIENHAEDIRLSTLHKYAKALGKKVTLEIV
jgi:DNA-binding XRE family transcriptional regulator